MADLTKRDMDRLALVHPSLVAVVVEAARTCPVAFMVVEGLRSKEKMWENWGQGRTVAQCKANGVPVQYAMPKRARVTWLANPLASKHAIQAKTGFGHAVDLLPAPYDWKDPKAFDIVAQHVLAAAERLKVKVTWGADWDRDRINREKGESDSPHFQIEV